VTAIYLKLCAVAIFWGGTFIAGRLIAMDVGPFAAAFLRFAVAAGALGLIMLKNDRGLTRPRRGLLPALFLLGLTGVFAYNVFFFNGLKLIEAGRASIIIANNPIGIALLAAILFKERLTVLKLSGILISITGALVVITRGQLAEVVRGGFGAGEIYIVGCVLSWVSFTLIGKTVVRELTPLASIFYAATIGAVLLFIPACMEGMLRVIGGYSLLDWMSIFYLGLFGTVLGFVWYYEGIRRIGATRAGLFINLVPISAILLGFFILQEPLSPSLLGGAVLVLSGVYLTNRPGAAARPMREGRVPIAAGKPSVPGS
jgi:drug/metabolite transporter (DMT)-like permease